MFTQRLSTKVNFGLRQMSPRQVHVSQPTLQLNQIRVTVELLHSWMTTYRFESGKCLFPFIMCSSRFIKLLSKQLMSKTTAQPLHAKRPILAVQVTNLEDEPSQILDGRTGTHWLQTKCSLSIARPIVCSPSQAASQFTVAQFKQTFFIPEIDISRHDHNIRIDVHSY